MYTIPALIAHTPTVLVRVDAPALLAPASFAQVLVEVAAAALLTLAPYAALVIADVHAAALLTLAPYVLVLVDSRTTPHLLGRAAGLWRCAHPSFHRCAHAAPSVPQPHGAD